MKRAFALILLALSMSAVGPLFAHDQYRIIGTITKPPQPKSIEVKTKDGKLVSIELNRETLISRDRKKADFTELKMDGSVVVDALGDSYDDLVALEVRIVPPITVPPR